MANEATPIDEAFAASGWPYTDGKTLGSITATMNAEQRRAHEMAMEGTQRLCREHVQKFFADLAASIVTPHVGDVYRDTIRSILHRAQEAGLYQPETP